MVLGIAMHAAVFAGGFSAAGAEWSTISGKGLTCSSAEYRGGRGAFEQPEGCLETVKDDPEINYAIYQPSKQCYVCRITGDPSTWHYEDMANVTSFARPAQTYSKLVNPCLDPTSPAASMKWCDSTRPLGERVEDMISRMTVTEKIGSMRDTAAAIPSLHLQRYNWWSEGTHGVASGEHGVDNTEEEPFQTNFPFPITTGMSFNRTLWNAIGGQIGREARAFMNAGNAFSTFWAPVINLAREPRWGRNIETPGEDPYLSGEYAVAFVKGMEESPDDPGHIQASACCKHLAANSMEHTTEGGETHTRHNFDENITMQDLVDSYLAPFQACVEKGKVSGLMCSYNAINGVPACADSWLLQEVARDAWGFDGYVTSDCGAESDVFYNHHYTNTPEESVREILRAGTDNDCGGFFGEHAQSALDKGTIVESDLDERLRNLFRVRMRLSHFDPKGPLDMIPPTEICSEHAKTLARDAVTQSIALLKNDNETLPLDASSVRSVAVIGPSAKQPGDLFSYYGPSTSCDNKYWNMVDAVQQYVANASYAAGLPSTLSGDVSQVEAAAELARGADIVVLVLGTDLSAAHEEMDAHNISLSDGQLALVRAVAEAAQAPVIVVTLTAVPLDLSPLLTNPKVGAVLHAGQPSMQTLGIGDVLFGKQVPAGRLIQTIYPKSYADEVSIFDFNMRPGSSSFPRPDCMEAPCPMGTNPGRTYRFYTGQAVVPFGYGLSYTKFVYEIVSAPSVVSLAAVPGLLQKSSHGFVPTTALEAAGPAATYTVNVTNAGNVDADEVVLGFVTSPGAGENGVALTNLFAFERVHVPAGITVTVNLYPAFTDFTHVDGSGNRSPMPGYHTISFGVASDSNQMGYAEHVVLAQLDSISI